MGLEMAGHLLGLGIPVAFQNVIIGFGGIVIQYVINGFGLLYVAGFTATNKLYGLLELAAVSFATPHPPLWDRTWVQGNTEESRKVSVPQRRYP